MIMILFYLNFIMSFLFLFMNHPMTMGLILMIQTILISIISGLFSYTYWFSYILFLIMVGGMLILFMYMTSLASNEKLLISNKLIFIIIPITMTIMMFLIMDPMIFHFLLKNFNLMELLNNHLLLKNENMISLNSLYNFPNTLITIMLINYLFLTLVAVVKITKSNMGPLRQKF